MKDFQEWFYTMNIPDTDKFQLFSVPHYLYMFIGVIVIFGLILSVKKCKKATAIRLIKICSILLFASYFYRSYIFYRHYENYSYFDILPIHLCIIASFVIPAAIFLNNKVLLSLSYSALMPGAAFAIMTPDGMLTWFHYLGWFPLFFFVWHFLVVLIPVLTIASGLFVPDIRQYPKVSTILILYAALVYPFNKKFESNYLYLNQPAKGSILEVFSKWLGNPGYIFPMIIFALIVIFIMYVPWWLKVKIKSE